MNTNTEIETETKGYWSAQGSVRGACGHHHRTEEAAQACATRDQRGIRSANPSSYPTRAYSDRRPVFVAVG